MPDQIQLRGGSSAENDAFTGVAREVTVDTTNKTLRVHDGTTSGGSKLAAYDEWGRLQVADPVDDSDAASKVYVDTAVGDSQLLVQELHFTSNTDDSTTSSLFEPTNLSGSITPQYNDSIIMAMAYGYLRRTATSDSSQINAHGAARLYNVTDDTDLVGAELVRFGIYFRDASSQPKSFYFPMSLAGRYVVNSLVERTFRVDIRRDGSATGSSSLMGSEATSLLVLRELRP